MVSDLLRERLGPSSTYVESLISIQRAYINTNHPNFLGAAAAMSSVINAKQEKEKKAVLAEERRKRERRRLKEAGSLGVNGAETPEDDEAAEEEKTTQGGLAIRAHQHQHKGSRSMSPAVRGMDGHGNIAAHLNGHARGGSPPRMGGLAAAGSATTGSTRDSFLNYFFGKEGQLPPGGMNNNNMPSAGGNRHVSHGNEPSFSQSIRRGTAASQYAESEYDRDQDRARREIQLQQQSNDYDYNSPFVRTPSHVWVPLQTHH